MSRKLNWNKSLDNPDATIVHEVVRSYISSSIEKQELQINQQDPELTNVSSNVKKNASKKAQSHVSKISIINVPSNTLNDVVKNASSNVQTNVEQDTVLNVLDNVVIGAVSNASIDVASNVTSDASTDVSSITPDKENTPIITKKKREDFKRDPLNNSVAAMAEWHTRAEQKVYEVMYKETIMHRQRTRYFSYKELSTKTGLRNNRTIINAVSGLQEKKSIDVSPSRRGEKLGREYSIYPPHEILSRRREAGMKIHSQTKKILKIDNNE